MLKINADVYYKHKSKFKSEYKKLGLCWKEGTEKGDIWGNSDNSSFLRKLPEEGNWKRFHAFNVPRLVEFLKTIGAIEVDERVDEYKPELIEEHHFIGSDLDSPSRRKFQEMLRALPDNFTCFYWDTLDYANASPEFKLRWRNLQYKYSNYTFNDFLAEIRAKNVRSVDDDVVVVAKRKVDDDILPSGVGTKKKSLKSSKKKDVKRNPVKSHIKVKPQVEFKKKVFTITMKRKE